MLLKPLLAEIKKRVLKETVYTVYHGTNERFDDFDLTKSAQGVFWFTDSEEAVKNADVGVGTSKYIMKRRIELKNPAGWDEYDKYSIDELINMGYDGVILPDDGKTDYIVFHPESIKKY
jgi:hypothetical protein